MALQVHRFESTLVPAGPDTEMECPLHHAAIEAHGATSPLRYPRLVALEHQSADRAGEDILTVGLAGLAPHPCLFGGLYCDHIWTGRITMIPSAVNAQDIEVCLVVSKSLPAAIGVRPRLKSPRSGDPADAVVHFADSCVRYHERPPAGFGEAPPGDGPVFHPRRA